MNDKKWIRSSLRQVSRELETKGFDASAPTVSRLLYKNGYSQKSNRKEIESASDCPDRDKQFKYINKLKNTNEALKIPIISVDTKKKELIGNYKNAGTMWRKEALRVNVHDFPGDSLGRAVPYGVYDLINNMGYVSVGTSGDTAEFAVDSLTSWWGKFGKIKYPKAKELLILADGGGSNNCRSRLWKKELQEMCDELGLSITVCHYPTGCSKWNPIEHKLFSYISMNWAGKPLENYEVMLKCIRGTQTASGLTVEAELFENEYEIGKKVSNREMAEINIKPHKLCPQWNYTVTPRKKTGFLEGCRKGS